MSQMRVKTPMAKAPSCTFKRFLAVVPFLCFPVPEILNLFIGRVTPIFWGYVAEMLPWTCGYIICIQVSWFVAGTWARQQAEKEASKQRRSLATHLTEMQRPATCSYAHLPKGPRKEQGIQQAG